MNGKKNKKPFSDPRWREWPKEGVKFYGEPNEQVKRFREEYFKKRKKEKEQHNN